MFQDLNLKQNYKLFIMLGACFPLIMVCLFVYLLFTINDPDVQKAIAFLLSKNDEYSLLLNIELWKILLTLSSGLCFWSFVSTVDAVFSKKPYAKIYPDRIEIGEVNNFMFLKAGTLYWDNIEEIMPRLPNAPFDNSVIIKLKHPEKFTSKLKFSEKLLLACLKLVTLGRYKKKYLSEKIALLSTQEMSAPELRALISDVSGIQPSMVSKQFKQLKKQQSWAIGSLAVYLLALGTYWNYDTIVSYLPDRKITSATLDIKALAEHGDPDAQTKLGWRYSRGYEASQNSKTAVHWWEKAAKQGWTKAEYNMGWAYSRGRGVKRNYIEAYKWYSRAALKEFALAESSLGYLYSNGKGVKKDYRKAFEWRLKAAERGELTAQGGLGWHYAKGKGVEKDYTEALKWFQTAAKEGHTYSESWLGWMYEKGNGVPKSREKALMYYERAAAKNYKYAIKRLKRLKG